MVASERAWTAGDGEYRAVNESASWCQSRVGRSLSRCTNSCEIRWLYCSDTPFFGGKTRTSSPSPSGRNQRTLAFLCSACFQIVNTPSLENNQSTHILDSTPMRSRLSHIFQYILPCTLCYTRVQKDRFSRPAILLSLNVVASGSFQTILSSKVSCLLCTFLSQVDGRRRLSLDLASSP